MMMMAAPMVVVTPVVMMVPAMMVVAPIMMVMMVLHLLRPIHSGIRAWICCTTEDVSACRNCRDQQHPNLKQNCQGQAPQGRLLVVSWASPFCGNSPSDANVK